MSTIEKIYEAQLAAQKEQLKQDYTVADSDLTHQKQLNQKATDANLTRTAVESQKAAVNNAELHNAYGLSSGTRAQARLAQENQLQADLTALRAAQQASDAEVERQRGILAQEYASAIRQAQAENDLAKAEALYEQAQKEQAAILERQQAAAQLMAQAGDYSRIASLYGLSSKEVAALQAAQQATATQNQDTGGGLTWAQATKLYEETGDATYLADSANLTGEKRLALTGELETVTALKAKWDSMIGSLKSRGASPENLTRIIVGWLNNADLSEDALSWLASQYGLI